MVGSALGSPGLVVIRRLSARGTNRGREWSKHAIGITGAASQDKEQRKKRKPRQGEIIVLHKISFDKLKVACPQTLQTRDTIIFLHFAPQIRKLLRGNPFRIMNL